MGGVYSDEQEVYQTLSVPAGATYARLVFHWYMNSEDDEDKANDVLSVRLLNAAGEPLMLIARRDNTHPRQAWVTTRYSWLGDFPYAGQTIRLSFLMTTNESRNTNLFLDDISFSVSAAPIDGASRGLVETTGR